MLVSTCTLTSYLINPIACATLFHLYLLPPIFCTFCQNLILLHQWQKSNMNCVHHLSLLGKSGANSFYVSSGLHRFSNIKLRKIRSLLWYNFNDVFRFNIYENSSFTYIIYCNLFKATLLHKEKRATDRVQDCRKKTDHVTIKV